MMGLKCPVHLCIDIIKQMILAMNMKCFCVALFLLESLLINWHLYGSTLERLFCEIGAHVANPGLEFLILLLPPLSW